ncbi:hypothetical protein SH528x_002113 [Novipirellula sp. SH528]|uniref:hypothetical protein n=1 Tax=Novipirellula sp. SH528 TaxID=3454466 RepID=UPI003FA04CA6
MAAIRLIPQSDYADFPRLEVKALIERLPGVVIVPTDFDAMISAGRDAGWSDELFTANQQLATRGNCIDFQWPGPPKLTGAVYEDNAYFLVADDYRQTLELIENWAIELGTSVYEHDPLPPPPAPCPQCGQALRTPKSKQCFACGADWH